MHRELTYFSARNCYKKRRNGITYYVGKGSQRDSDENYRRAWGEWEAKLAELVAKEQAQRQAAGLPAILRVIREGTPTPEQHEATGFPLPPTIAQAFAQGPTGLTPEQLRALLDYTGMLPKTQQEQASRTVGEMFDRFLADKRQQAKTDQRSVGRFANVESYGKAFRDFVGASKPANAIDGVILSDYYRRQLEQIDADEITTWAGRDRMQVARQFIRYCFEAGVIDLPRNIDSKNLVINCTPGEIKPMPVESLRARIKKAKGILQVQLILMANCGFYQQDCADLLHTEVDWKAGTITRRRSKTSKIKSDNIPVVTYHLWPTTLELLRLQATNDSHNVLATRTGRATVHATINAQGKASRSDSTAQAYARLQDEIEGTRWPLKSIRKLGATLIGNNKDFSRFAAHYLGDAPGTVADAHYVRPSEEQFKACLEWLGKHWRLDIQAAIASD